MIEIEDRKDGRGKKETKNRREQRVRSLRAPERQSEEQRADERGEHDNSEDGTRHVIVERSLLLIVNVDCLDHRPCEINVKRAARIATRRVRCHDPQQRLQILTALHGPTFGPYVGDLGIRCQPRSRVFDKKPAESNRPLSGKKACAQIGGADCIGFADNEGASFLESLRRKRERETKNQRD